MASVKKSAFTSDVVGVEDWSDGDPSTASQPVPSRGVRPRNRRELVLVAAADLFYSRGYHRVSMGDLAQQVGMGPSALYRHFRSKQDVLRIVVVGALEVLVEQCETSTEPLPGLLGRIGVDHRRTGVLVRRERAYLEAADAAVAEELLARLRRAVVTRVLDSRPDLDDTGARLMTEALLTATWSRSFDLLDAEPERAALALGALCDRLLTAEVPVSGATRPPAPTVLRSRRETLLGTAISLFATEGYPAVTVAQICSGAGASTASAYQLLGTKDEILHAASLRSAEQLMAAHAGAVRHSPEPVTAARLALGAMARWVLDNADLAAIVGVEFSHLADDPARVVQAARSSYAEEWDALLADVLPDVARADRMIRVVALIVSLGELARDKDLRAAADLEPVLLSLGTALLDLPS